ncbi:hypothetical protein BDK51DRAFT_27235 [Blyttiomyces helicus]|uniref:Uncharacterized protein n=1 Tax=Blyttiomyces helicus TaxID=388810 RepID=A0A4P9W2U2_9FUNG|nr:hypothetical protein BDK51DRAFT_27235 [Blyttiomyces helicus]|eukprot:RKO86474.1 hypothetical protein BDK51DRAFT_27235 [Blyttiomyces helicus]
MAKTSLARITSTLRRIWTNRGSETPSAEPTSDKDSAGTDSCESSTATLCTIKSTKELPISSRSSSSPRPTPPAQPAPPPLAPPLPAFKITIRVAPHMLASFHPKRRGTSRSASPSRSSASTPGHMSRPVNAATPHKSVSFDYMHEVCLFCDEEAPMFVGIGSED